MKPSHELRSCLRIGSLTVLGMLLWLASAHPGMGLSSANPYQPIVERNVFALKPPTPVTTTAPEVAAPPPGLELRGVSLLFGRPQVLLNIKEPAKPPEPPKERSLVLYIGDREGDVQILDINVAAGSVRLRNQGKEIAMNLKDNAVKPTAAAAAPAVPGVPALPVPGVPAPRPAAPTGGAATLPTVPNANPVYNNPGSASLPTRNIRSNTQQNPGIAGGFNDPTEQAAAIEVLAEADKAKIDAGVVPPPPFTGVRRRQ